MSRKGRADSEGRTRPELVCLPIIAEGRYCLLGLEGTNCLLGRWGVCGIAFSIGSPQSADPGGRSSLPLAWMDTRDRKRRAGRGSVKAGKRGNLAPHSELGGAAGVALQQTHDGRVAFGSADELLQGQLACRERGTVIRKKAAPKLGEAKPSGGEGKRCGSRPPPPLTVVVRVHLAEDLLSPLFRGRLVLWHLHHR